MANPQMVAERVIILSLDGTIQQIQTGSNPLLVQRAVIAFDEDVVADALIQHSGTTGAIPASVTTSTANYSLPAAGGREVAVEPYKEFPNDGAARTDLRHWFIKMSASGGKARVRYWQMAEDVTPT